MVKFFVVLKDDLFRVTTSDDCQILDIFEELKSDAARRILYRTSVNQYQYYKLKNPVPLPRTAFNRGEIVRTCLRQSNWEELDHYDALDVLSTTLGASHVYLVIQPRGGETERAIADLKTNFAELFSCLQITVSSLQRWTMQDVRNNLASGKFLRPQAVDRPGVSGIEESLAQRRAYIVPEADDITDYRNARIYDTHFDQVFTPTLDSSGQVTNREFLAFFNILRCFDPDSDRIQSDPSSTLKTSNFIVYFILPPFFSCLSQHFEFKQEKLWQFPIFLSTPGQPDSWCQFRPRSDLMVSSRSFLFPFLISEAILQGDERDRYRMLLQAIAVARTGQYLMEAGAPMRFFVVAVYLRADLTAERYVVTTTESDTDTGPDTGTEPGREVSIGQKDFALTTAEDAVAFLREMYNLVAMVEKLAGHLDQSKMGMLSQVQAVASKMISLTRKAKEWPPTRSTLDSVSEGGRSDEAQDDLGVFGADDIQALLRRMNYKINFILFGFPLVASVSNVANESENGYLKFVQEGRKEIEILQYLTGIKCPTNHTIAGVQIWPVLGGTIILMPVAGGWLTGIEEPDTRLWSVAKQLFEAVDFMHQHGVAHMDLKPQNILIPRNGSRLSIIDFNTSLRVKGIEHRVRGIVGTTGYTAPEVVRDDLYSAIRADLWSCGKTLEELCLLCRPSIDRDTLFEISQQLMDEDPEKRPAMSDVLDRLSRCTPDEVP